ncbi:hypothetical protein GOP47_0010020 [Adiantum capillus-veneris]|uniref:Uncharacterized protein n=1 Tax=Adiantum capillus-veneris TaxID=13818 RepID=A0A9D4UXX5_ADICA|nr:hypothetical protein GOP47_0010020 [Adiantum capillus-veneris]
MVSWSETDSESSQKGQSNESTDVPTLEAKVNTMLQELPDVCQHQLSPSEKFVYEVYPYNSPGHEDKLQTQKFILCNSADVYETAPASLLFEEFCLALIMWDLPTFVWDQGGRL